MNKRLVKSILEKPLDRLWTAQGFGKMATNITSNSRLHIWHRMLVNTDVPAIHSHASDFQSVVLVGRMRNLRFVEIDTHASKGGMFNKILSSDSEQIIRARLVELPMEIYEEDAQYKQSAEEVHWSLPDDGTVTIVEWDFDPHPLPMKVYWRGNLPWCDAKPRQMPDHEVLNVARRVLSLWF